MQQRSDESQGESRVAARRYAHAQRLVLGQLTGRKGPAPGLAEDRRSGSDRRRRSLRTFIYGNFRPRRRQSRRGADHHAFLFDWHEPAIMYVALAIVLLSCTDALFTLNLLKIGAEEANALMNGMIARGVEVFLWVKITVTNVAVLALVVAAQRHFMGLFKVYRLLHLVLAGYVGLIIYEIYLFSTILGLGPLSLIAAIIDA